jgi:hypothetical protein
MTGTAEKIGLVAKYRATEAFKQALEIIAPDPERREKCEYDVAVALWGIMVAAKIDKFKSVRTPAQYRSLLQKLAKRLRADIELAAKAFPPEYQIRQGKDSWIGEELKRHLKVTEDAIDWISKRVRKGSPRVSEARIMAVDDAYLLLKRYGKRPTRYRDGDWHKLARVLFGNEQADLFEYLGQRLPHLIRFLSLVGRR